MTRAQRIGMAIIVAMVGIDCVLAGAAYGERTDVSGTRTLNGTVPIDDHDLFVVNPADNHAINLRITVSGGGAIDVYSMPSTGYSQYTNPSATSFTYYPPRSSESVTTFDMRVAPDTDAVYVVIDNTDMVGATPSGTVTYTATFTDSDIAVSSSLNWVGGLLILIFLIFGGTIIRFAIRRARARRSPPAAMMGAPGASMYGQTGAPMYGQPGVPAYGQPGAARAGYAPPPPPPARTAEQLYGPPPGTTYVPSQTAACPTCNANVTVGAASCPSCGMGLSWA